MSLNPTRRAGLAGAALWLNRAGLAGAALWLNRAGFTALAGGAALLPGRPALAEETVAFDGLYKSFGVRGLEYADRLRALAGQRVAMRGYMAPPLKAESPFFVLTRAPLTLCPFCQSDAEWPIDIVVVYLRRTAPLLDGGTPLQVRGRLEIGSWTDPDSGFVSLVRLVDASFAAG